MRKIAKNTLNTRSSALRFVVSAVVLVLFLYVVFAPSTADAICPDGYVSEVKDKNLDWQNGSSDLNLDYVKATVGDWMKNKHYSFADLEKHPVVIAVIDTGINFNHEIFTGKYDQNGVKTDDEGIGEYDVLYRDKDGKVISTNTASSSKDATDDSNNRHGTHVAGIIATLIHELDLEKYVKIMPIKASYNSWGETTFKSTAVRAAIDFAIENGADVINMSISDKGADPGTSTDFDMVTKEDAQKAVFVAAAGNNSTASSTVGSAKGKWYYPAANKHVIGVMNYAEENGKKSLVSSSNFGDVYDICAPGNAIFSADGKSNESYKSLTGTSMATPIVAFASALMIVKDRAFCSATNDLPKSYEEVAGYVKSSFDEQIVKTVKTLTSSRNFSLGVFDFKSLLSDEVKARILAKEYGGSLVQNLNDVKSVILHLEIFPSVYTEQGLVEWKVDGKSVENPSGDEFEFEYTPENKIGSVKISAEWTCEEITVYAECSVEVKYLEYSSSETAQIKINAVSGGINLSAADGETAIQVESGKTIEFSIDKSLLSSVSPDTIVMWYVDGAYVASGANLSYKFEREGVHFVKAKIGGYFTSATTFKVVETRMTMLECLRLRLFRQCARLEFALFVLLRQSLSRRREAATTDLHTTKPANSVQRKKDCFQTVF